MNDESSPKKKVFPSKRFAPRATLALICKTSEKIAPTHRDCMEKTGEGHNVERLYGRAKAAF
jgi:hypothetical protein